MARSQRWTEAGYTDRPPAPMHIYVLRHPQTREVKYVGSLIEPCSRIEN